MILMHINFADSVHKTDASISMGKYIAAVETKASKKNDFIFTRLTAPNERQRYFPDHKDIEEHTQSAGAAGDFALIVVATVIVITTPILSFLPQTNCNTFSF
ncbi:hypothetical protein GQX74_001008 [Glossina fuscipes]|nr:hypothetical protein GQX74_001008 [Glossina fuscipes]